MDVITCLIRNRHTVNGLPVSFYLASHLIYIIKQNMQTLSRDFQRACGEMHAQTPLGKQWCVKNCMTFSKIV